MPTLTPKLALKKPIVNVETDWGYRLNETIDILDGAALTANITGLGSVTYTDFGGGTVTISGQLLVGKGAITLIPEGSALVISGTGGTHGALPGLENDDHPQYAHLAQNETISGTWNFVGYPTISGQPVATGTGTIIHDMLQGLLDDDHPQYVLADGTRAITGDLVVISGVSAASGTITEVLTAASGSIQLTHDGITVSGVRVATLADAVISGSGYSAYRTINTAVGSGTESILNSDFLIVVSGLATNYELVLPSANSVLGRSFRVQLPFHGALYPNLNTLNIETQPGEKKDGVVAGADSVVGYQLATGQRGTTFMAVGGDYDWIALKDSDT
jgi:hypothetical protein